MTATITLRIGGQALEAELDDYALATIAAAVAEQSGTTATPAPASPYMTIPEAATYLRCSRQRIDDLLSQKRLQRFKDGSRTLISRTELETHMTGSHYRRNTR